MVNEGDLKAISCSFWDDVLCLYKKVKKFVILSRCFECEHYKRFEREMDDEEERFWAKVDDARKEEGFRCYCDGKLCDNDVLGGCFSVEVDNDSCPTDVLRWVCPRFDVNRVSGVTKTEFLRLHKREGGVA